MRIQRKAKEPDEFSGLIGGNNSSLNSYEEDEDLKAFKAEYSRMLDESCKNDNSFDDFDTL